MSGRSRSQSGLFFLFQWVLVNAVGWAVGATLRQLGLGIVGATIGFALGRAVEGAVIGTAIGLAQLWVLPQPPPRTGGWVLASALAWGVAWSLGWSLGWSVVGSMGLRMVFVAMGALAGLIGGIVQWALIRRGMPRAGWWVLASGLGWAVGLGLTVSVGRALGWILAGAFGGLITGISLLWLWRESK